MIRMHSLPHRPMPGMCPVNGIRDLVHWRAGCDWSNEFVWGLGQGGGFAYLRINPADPPRQVYTGIAPPRQHRYLADLFSAGLTESEGRVFKTAWAAAREAVDAGTPPVLGPLDMFHLPCCEGIYRTRHIPIHYLLLVGYDEDAAYVHDTGSEDVRSIPLEELRQAWDVNVPGLGKRNRLAALVVPRELPPARELVRRAIADQATIMLRPPVSMLGIPAMRKVARDIAGWPEELGAETAAKCLRQVREFLSSPPDPEGSNLTGGRDRYLSFLAEAAPLTGLDFTPAARHLRESMAAVPPLAAALDRGDLAAAAVQFDCMAAAETKAYTALLELVAGDAVG